MNKNLKLWGALVLFSLIGQVAWTVENMYLNVFIYKMFHATASDISLMVSASAITAALTTILIGALSDKVGKRKVFICGGYILWGISILTFSAIRLEYLEPLAGSTVAAATLGVQLVIVVDCLMTFLGSSANDACFNAWLTESGDESNRGKLEGVNAMMPVLSILVVFGGFMSFNLDVMESWVTIFMIIGVTVMSIGILGIFLIEDHVETNTDISFWHNVCYSFTKEAITQNPLLYLVIGAFAVFGIAIQVYMPYLILYYEQTLQLTNYTLVLAPAIIIASIVTVAYGKLYDMLGFQTSIKPSLLMLIVGCSILYLCISTVWVFIGSLFMMCGYLCSMAVFGAMMRSHIPVDKSGQFQGVRIIGQVLIPGIVGPWIGSFVLRNADIIVNNDGTTSFLPSNDLFLVTVIIAIIVLLGTKYIEEYIRNANYTLTSIGQEDIKDSDILWKEYPRPQMKRSNWMSLNGIWDLDGTSIRVPFPPQSALSLYTKKVKDTLTYTRKFTVNEYKKDEHVLLHFGAVDQIAEVYVNGNLVGKHEGGYLPFTFDITSYITYDSENELVVKAVDTLSTDYPYGKQTKTRGGMWYTPVSGIWKSVWLEQVPSTYITNIKITPDLKGIQLEVNVEGEYKELRASVTLPDGSVYTQPIQKNDYILLEGLVINEDNNIIRHWTPQDPYLYTMKITCDEDEVETYFALRTIEIKEYNGKQRVCLNGEPIFLHGILDQGYFCDGIFLPSEEKEYERDILRMKELGLNLLRKHIKIEPECFYYYCDLHGMLVMQDHVNSGRYNFLRDTALPTIGLKNLPEGKKNDSKQQIFFTQHMLDTQEYLYNHPSIISYTVFNEAWGQFDSNAMYKLAKENDPTRIYDATSGWFAKGENDFDSEHIYFKSIPLSPKERPLLLSEFGGYTYLANDHVFAKYSHYGYGVSETKEELQGKISDTYRTMVIPFIKEGLCGSIYTQLSDVEDEINGLYTYDRKVCKVDQAEMCKLRSEMDKIIEEIKGEVHEREN